MGCWCRWAPCPLAAHLLARCLCPVGRCRPALWQSPRPLGTTPTTPTVVCRLLAMGSPSRLGRQSSMGASPRQAWTARHLHTTTGAGVKAGGAGEVGVGVQVVVAPQGVGRCTAGTGGRQGAVEAGVGDGAGIGTGTDRVCV